jgi:hypothetical protein
LWVTWFSRGVNGINHGEEDVPAPLRMRIAHMLKKTLEPISDRPVTFQGRIAEDPEEPPALREDDDMDDLRVS